MQCSVSKEVNLSMASRRRIGIDRRPRRRGIRLDRG